MHTEPRASPQRLGLWQAWLSFRLLLHIRRAVWVREGRTGHNLILNGSSKESCSFLCSSLFICENERKQHLSVQAVILTLVSCAAPWIYIPTISKVARGSWPSSGEILPGKIVFWLGRKMRTNEKRRKEKTRPPFRTVRCRPELTPSVSERSAPVLVIASYLLGLIPVGFSYVSLENVSLK